MSSPLPTVPVPPCPITRCPTGNTPIEWSIEWTEKRGWSLVRTDPTPTTRLCGETPDET